jgi:hypothetical protein
MRVEIDNVLFFTILLCIIGFLFFGAYAEENDKVSNETANPAPQITQNSSEIPGDIIYSNDLESITNP